MAVATTNFVHLEHGMSTYSLPPKMFSHSSPPACRTQLRFDFARVYTLNQFEIVIIRSSHYFVWRNVTTTMMMMTCTRYDEPHRNVYCVSLSMGTNKFVVDKRDRHVNWYRSSRPDLSYALI